MTWLIVLVAIACSLYPLFVVLRPAAAIRVQVRQTANGREAIGGFFERLVRIDPNAEPWDDVGARHRVRLFGTLELVVIWLVAVVLIVAVG